jgi:hypothetical protein
MVIINPLKLVLPSQSIRITRSLKRAQNVSSCALLSVKQMILPFVVAQYFGKFVLSSLGQNDEQTCLARLILNYEGIDYKIQWIEYPEIEGT